MSNLASTGESQPWAFDLEHRGRRGQGITEATALQDLQDQCGYAVGSPIEVRDRVDGDEQAFRRDLAALAPQEIATTLSILGQVRRRTLILVGDARAAGP